MMVKHDKLDLLIEKLSLNPNSGQSVPSESREAIDILQNASNLLDINGSGITFYPGDDEGMVRCDDCFAAHFSNDQTIVVVMQASTGLLH